MLTMGPDEEKEEVTKSDIIRLWETPVVSIVLRNVWFLSFCLAYLSEWWIQWLGWHIDLNKNLCGPDGGTICGPLCVPKSTYVTLAHKRKQKFFYFGCSLVRRFYCKINNNGTDGQTDGQTDRQTDRVRRNMRPPPREEGRIITV